MDSLKCLAIWIVLFLYSTLAKATDGCLITGGTELYDTPTLNVLTGGYKLYTNSLYPLSSNYCSWAAVSYTGNTCGVCSGLGICVFGICPCIGTAKYGLEGSFTMVLCNFDDHSWLLGAAAGIFGLLVIKRRNKL
ncbi:hypothetical protein J7E50_24170 [Pedobacter sp. ISL-68]|uniref:hypothetical protein n=1 Tax=unclassified Pedobacter TaxID=2628915 RepID=UPI001BE7F93B|nr:MULTISPECIES: hypothetical protein [unclassified Pedobacter]MBT2562825.1 hypothetical protein [Pedobacter sp. ISL-64]MBT2593338.1 hypothetical protein [Pedobacter sp. ISL-68]